MTSIYVPEPVISLAISPADNNSADRMAKALNRFTKEDPTFRSHVDPESNETIIQGMGELHLDVYLERMKREYRAEVHTGKPQVAYREAISQKADFDYTHKKQTGGSGQYGRVVGAVEPIPKGVYEFVNEVKGGRIPKEFIPSCDKGFRAVHEEGRAHRLPGHRRPGHPQATASPTPWTPRTSPSRWPPRAPSGRCTRRRSRRSSSPS